MNCREFNEFLMAYLDHELPLETLREFERHVGLCPPCLAFLESYRTTIHVGKIVCAHPEDPVPADVPEKLVQAILRSLAKQP